MKRILKMAAVALAIMLGSSWQSDLSAQPYPPDESYQDGEVTYQTFYDELSPHGRWVDHPQHGYIWMPNAGPDFRPYSTSGHWVFTDNYEWMWVSDYDWGWATFHYGRWDYDPYYGWYWVPGYEWAPAWVAWRDGGDYYGWAPLRPGISISINFSIGSYNPPYDFWCFTPRRYILYNNVFNHYIDRRQNVTIINQTTIINNYNYSRNVFMTGPRRSSVEVYTGRITPVRFRESSRPGRTSFRNNEVSTYRPTVRRDEGRRFSPRNVERYDRQQGNISRQGNNDGRIERGNTNRRDGNISGQRNGNNLPQRDRNIERPSGGRTNDQPVLRGRQGNDNRMNPGQNRRNTVGGNNDRVTGQSDRQMRRMEQPGNIPGNNNSPRTFERRNNDQPVTRQPQNMPRENPGRTMPQMNERRADQPRQMERPQVPGRQQMERRPEQTRPQQMERRQEQARPQMERRQEQARPQMERRVEQPRQQQMERRQEQVRPQTQSRQSGTTERGNSNGRGNGRGRGN